MPTGCQGTLNTKYGRCEELLRAEERDFVTTLLTLSPLICCAMYARKANEMTFDGLGTGSNLFRNS